MVVVLFPEAALFILFFRWIRRSCFVNRFRRARFLAFFNDYGFLSFATAFPLANS